MRYSIFQSLHNISHPSGAKSASELIKSRYFWPEMDKFIRKWCSECVSCQQTKMGRHVKSPFQNFSVTGERFQTVHMDIVGPLPSVQNIGDPYKVIIVPIVIY